MTKVAIITDTHIGIRNSSLVLHSYMEMFYRDIFFPYLKKHSIKHILHLGDMVENQKSITWWADNWARNVIFNPIIENDIKMTAIVGNHDIPFKNNDINAVDGLISGYDNNFVSVKEPTEITIDGVKILMVPWINPSEEENVINAISRTKSTILMGHLDIAGFNMYKNIPHKGNGRDPKLFDKFMMVLSGHYHHKSTNGVITYLGCPYEMTWNDYDDQKGFHILDLQSLKLTMVKNPYTAFKAIIFDENTDIDDLSGDDISNKFVRVIVKKKDDLYRYDQFIKKIEELSPIDLDIIDQTLFIDQTNTDDSVSVDDTITFIKGFIHDASFPNKEVNKQRLTQEMFELYDNANRQRCL